MSAVVPVGPTTLVNTLITLSINHTAETTDGVTLTTPIEGAVPCTFTQAATLGGIPMAQYGTAYQYTYVPNGTYSLTVATSIGTVSSTMSAPGAISFDSSGVTATAVYPGNYDSAICTRIYPAPATTFNSGTTTVGSPFVFPPSTYSSPSNPATFGTTYSAAQTVLSFTGPAAVGCAFVGDAVFMKYFIK